MKKVKFYLGVGGYNYEKICQYEDDVPEEDIDEDFEDWKNEKLYAQLWVMNEED